MLTKEQIEIRRTGIGASETAAILGLDPWKKPIDVYLRLHGLVQDRPNFHTKRGTFLEPALRAWASEEIGAHFVESDPRTLRHPQAEHVLASPDGMALRQERTLPLELKAPGPRTAYEWGDGDDAPERYVIQVAQQIAVLDAPEGYLAALVDGDLRIYRYERDAELEGMLLEACEDFWQRAMVRDEPPEPDGSESYRRYLTDKWGKHRGEMILANGEAEDILAEYRGARAAREAAELAEETCKQRLQRLIGDADGLSSPVLGHVYWRRSKDKKSTDWEAIARSMGAPAEVLNALIEQHTTKSPGPRPFKSYLKGA